MANASHAILTLYPPAMSASPAATAGSATAGHTSGEDDPHAADSVQSSPSSVLTLSSRSAPDLPLLVLALPSRPPVDLVIDLDALADATPRTQHPRLFEYRIVGDDLARPLLLAALRLGKGASPDKSARWKIGAVVAPELPELSPLATSTGDSSYDSSDVGDGEAFSSVSSSGSAGLDPLPPPPPPSPARDAKRPLPTEGRLAQGAALPQVYVLPASVIAIGGISLRNLFITLVLCIIVALAVWFSLRSIAADELAELRESPFTA